MNEDELEFVNKSEDKTSAFLEIWTAKEAYLKITGEGLAGLNKAKVLPFILKGTLLNFMAEVNHTDQYICTIIYEV